MYSGEAYVKDLNLAFAGKISTVTLSSFILGLVKYTCPNVIVNRCSDSSFFAIRTIGSVLDTIFCIPISKK